MAVITGTAGSDNLIGTDAADSITGLAGDDTIRAGIGSDTILGGDGNDRIIIDDNGSSDSIDGGSGWDWDGLTIPVDGLAMTLSSANFRGIDYFNLDGNRYNGATAPVQNVTVLDSIFSLNTTNIAIGLSAGNAKLNVDASNVAAGHNLNLAGGSWANNNDTLLGGAGDDYLNGGPGNDSLTGGLGNDTAGYYFGVTPLIGLALNATATGRWTLTSADGALMTLQANTSTGTWTVTESRTSIASTSYAYGVDTLNGIEMLGLDVQDSTGMRYRAANIYMGGTLVAPSLQLRDFALVGTQGNDTLTGRNGDDIIFAYGGSDSITGLGGKDEIHLTDNGSTDTIDGGEGFDFVSLSLDGTPITLGAGGNIKNVEQFGLTISGSNAQTVTVSDALFTSATPNWFRANVEAGGSIVSVKLDASALGVGHNVGLNGGNVNDTLFGGAGADKLSGGPADDSLDGGDGDDNLEGGPGNDSLTGGLGNDTAGYSFGVMPLTGLTLTATGTGTSGTSTWTLSSADGALLTLQANTSTGAWTVTDARTAIASTSSAFGLDTLNGIEMLGLDVQDSSGVGYRAATVYIGSTLTAPSLQLRAGTEGNDTLTGSNGKTVLVATTAYLVVSATTS